MSTEDACAMNLAIIGYGGMGAYHAENLRKFAEGESAFPIGVAGVYDIDPAVRKRRAASVCAHTLRRRRSGRINRSAPCFWRSQRPPRAVCVRPRRRRGNTSSAKNQSR